MLFRAVTQHGHFCDRVGLIPASHSDTGQGVTRLRRQLWGWRSSGLGAGKPALGGPLSTLLCSSSQGLHHWAFRSPWSWWPPSSVCWRGQHTLHLAFSRPADLTPTCLSLNPSGLMGRGRRGLTEGAAHPQAQFRPDR